MSARDDAIERVAQRIVADTRLRTNSPTAAAIDIVDALIDSELMILTADHDAEIERLRAVLAEWWAFYESVGFDPDDMEWADRLAAKTSAALAASDPGADRPEPEPTTRRCTGTLGSRPSWMGVDQYGPCVCRLDAGHDGPHWCEHLDVPDPRLPGADRPEVEG